MSGAVIALTSAWVAASLAQPADGAMGEPRLPAAEWTAQFDPAPPPAAAFGQHTLFVNFDGGVLNDNGENSRTNSTQIGFTGMFAPYGEGAKRTAVLQAVQADWQAYNILVTQDRPADGEYVMTMVGPTNFTGSLGVALLDCDNDWTQNNIVYAFHDIDDHFSAAGTATTVSQEVAHSYGLEHVDNAADIMNPINVGGDAAFLDECIAIIPASFGIACGAQHTRHCGNGEHQNGHAELLELIGTSEPDTEPPTVEISEPGDLTSYTEGESFRIEVDVQDNRGIARLTLYSNDLVVGTDDAEPWGWDVAEIPAGEYDFVAEALDAGGNTTRSEPIRVVVDPAPAGVGDTEGVDGADTDSDGIGGSGGPGADGGSDGSGGVDTDDAAAGGQSGPAAAGDEGPRYIAFDAGGCACTSSGDGGRPPRWAWSFLMLVAARRRSRRSR